MLDHSSFNCFFADTLTVCGFYLNAWF